MRLVLRSTAKALAALAVFFALAGTAPASEAAVGPTTLDQYRAIVVSPQASAVVKNAAEDLQFYLQQVANRELPLVDKAPEEGLAFFVGPGTVPAQDEAIAALPMEGWIIRSVPGGILLGGNAEGPYPKFTFYHAIPLFLENYCGVRWLWPGPIGEIVPVNPKLEIPSLDEEGAPALKIRRIDFYLSKFWEPKVREEFHRWQRNSLQGKEFPVSFAHAWGGYFNEKDFAEHPEWFAEVEGERRPPTKKRMSWQLCLSNPEMRDEFYRRLEKKLSGHNVVSVSPNDGGGFCECAQCRANGSIGDNFWDFVNDLATRLKKDHPDNGIGTFAYTFFRQPPEKIDQFPDNVWISMTTYSAGHVAPERKKEFLDFLSRWKTKNVNLIMREYWGMHYWQDLPILYPHEIAEGIRIAYESGLMGVYGEGSKNWSTQAPNYYVLTHTMWNPEADPDQLLNQFYAGFGPAEKPVREYFSLLEDAFRKKMVEVNPGIGWSSLAPLFGDIYTPELMAKASAQLDKARSLAGADQALQDRIAFLRIGCDYTTKMGRLFALYADLGIGGFAKKPPPELSFAQKKKMLEEAWELGQERIRLLNEATPTFALDDGTYANYMRPGSSWFHHGVVAELLGKSRDEMEVLDSYQRTEKPKK